MLKYKNMPYHSHSAHRDCNIKVNLNHKIPVVLYNKKMIPIN